MESRRSTEGGMPLPQQLALGTPQRHRVAKLSFDLAAMRTEVPEHQQFITMCRTRHFCRTITKCLTNKHRSYGAYAEVTA